MHSKNLFFAIIVIVCSLIFTACEKVTGEGPVRTETRSRGDFSGIDVRLPGNVNFRQDSIYKIEVTAQQNLLREIETNIVGNQLVIKIRDGVRIRSHDEINVTIAAPGLSAIRLSGSGNVNTNGIIESEHFLLDLSGSGNIFMQGLSADYLEGRISGSGNIAVFEGEVEEENLKISGSGNMDFLNMAAQSAYTSTSGSGSIKLNVADKLDASISGSGSVYYRGNPAVFARVSGSGTVIRL